MFEFNKIVGLSRGHSANKAAQAQAALEWQSSLAFHLGRVAEQQADTASAIKALLQDINRPYADPFPQVRRYDAFGTTKAGPFIFSLPTVQTWKIDRLLAIQSDNTPAPVAVNGSIYGLLPGAPEERMGLGDGVAGARPFVLPLGIPVYPEQAIYLQAGSATHNITVFVFYVPISR